MDQFFYAHHPWLGRRQRKESPLSITRSTLGLIVVDNQFTFGRITTSNLRYKIELRNIVIYINPID